LYIILWLPAGALLVSVLQQPLYPALTVATDVKQQQVEQLGINGYCADDTAEGPSWQALLLQLPGGQGMVAADMEQHWDDLGHPW
jgi:hypothetical protein